MWFQEVNNRSSSNGALLLAALSVALLGGGCGGGGGNSGGGESPLSVTVAGAVAKGSLVGALVSAYPVSDAGVVGSTELSHTTTDASGNYTLNLGNYTGAVQLVETAQAGTTTIDEATGLPVSLPTGFTMHADTVVTAVSGGQIDSASITPFTELANNIALGLGGLTSSNIVNASGVVFVLIGTDPVATKPIPSNAVPPSGSTVAQERYALFNAAVSELANSTPTTTDAATLACFSAAGNDRGLRIQCAVHEIGNAVTVTGSGTQAVASANVALVGLAGALVAASASSSVNQTGISIAPTDSYVQSLKALEVAASSGTPQSIAVGPITQAASDAATAKLFFSGLRANAAELQTGPTSSGIVDGMKAFGDSLQGDAATLTMSTLQMFRLAMEAQTLWTSFTTGQTTNPNSPSISGLNGGCTVYQGALGNFGGAAVGQPYVPHAIVATAPSNASWVSCAVFTGPLPTNGTSRYFQSIYFNMLADPSLAVIPVVAATRAQYVSAGTTYDINLTPKLTGAAGFTLTNGSLSAISITGDMPPATTLSGNLLAARYPVNIALTQTVLANGAIQTTFNGAQLGVVPIGGSAATLTINLSPGGQSGTTLPLRESTNAAVAAAAQVNLDATITEPNGQLTGNLLMNQFTLDSSGNIVIGHVKFTGSIAVAPVVASTAGPLVTWLGVTLEATNGSAPVVSFSGNLNLPGLPTLALQGSVTETSTNIYSLQASYIQAGLNVTIAGAQAPTASSITFADASGVSVTVTKASNTANVTVSGRQTAVIDKSSDMITYSDGTFETLLNPG